MTDLDYLDTYLAATALTLEGRGNDVLALINTLGPTDQIAMWFTGLSATGALASLLAHHHNLPPDRVAAWVRSIALTDVQDDHHA